MQRKQLERLKGSGASGGSTTGDSLESGSRASSEGVSSGHTIGGGASQQPNAGSHLTLDPASVEFAVSAVLSTTEVSAVLNSLVSSSSSTIPLSATQGDSAAAALARLSSVAANGPFGDGKQGSGL